MKIYKVGGCIRDQLLNIEPNDIDYCVEADSFSEMQEYLKNNNFEITYINEKYLTIKTKQADFTLCRKDGFYSDYRRPDLVMVGTIFDDLARRDFTINAIAIEEITGEFIDPYNGKKDLEEKIIRCVGTAYTKLLEDPLRIMRALRFSITKNFTISDDIWDVIYKEDKALEKISTDRLQTELIKMFSYNTIASINLINRLPESAKNILFSKIWLKPIKID